MNTITTESVFMVSGGGRGITAQCVIEMAKHYHCKFILLGRSSADGQDPDAVAGLTDEMAMRKALIQAKMAQGEKPTPAAVQKEIRMIRARREIQATLDAIEQTGGHAEYLSVDITDAAALQAGVADVVSRLGAVTGILHGAGTLSDKLIENKTVQDFEYVFGAKIEGLNNLLSVVPVKQLHHLILFSSAAGFYGNPGQADYAIANEILNKIAHYVNRHYPSCQVISMNWGPWDAGMVTEELKKIFEERNINVIPVDVGTRMLLEELDSPHEEVQILVGDPLDKTVTVPQGDLKKYRIRRRITEADNPFLGHHVVGQHAVLPMLFALNWIASTCEDLYPGYTFVRSDGFKVFKGIIFDETLADEYFLDIEETNRDEDRIIMDARVSSMVNERPRFHYGVQITLQPQQPDAPVITDFDLSERNPQAGSELYRNGTLFHGPYLQGIQRVLNISDSRVTTQCHLPVMPLRDQGQFYRQAFDPSAVDIALQSLLVMARHLHDAASLPLAIEVVEQYRMLPPGTDFYTTMDVVSSTDTTLIARVYAHDSDGRLYFHSDGATVTIRKAINDLFLQGSRRHHN